MKRLLLLGALCATCVLALAPAAGATSYAYGSCAEMPTQELAQGTLDSPDYSTLSASDDELHLDPDGDGVACNDPGNLVGGEAPEEPVEPPAEVTQPETPTQYEQPGTPTQRNRFCVDFASQAEAQAAFDANPAGLNGLDADGDGIACESTGSPADGITFEDGSARIEDAAGPTGQEAPQPGGAAYGYQYAPQSSIADADDAEGATEAASGDPADAATLKSAIEAARADRTGGIAPAAASEAVTEKKDASPPEEDAGEEEANPSGGSASGGSASRGSASHSIDELPATGGVSLALGAGALLLAGGLVARRIVN